MNKLQHVRIASVALLAAARLCAPPAYAQTAVEHYVTAEEFVGPFPSWKNIKTDYGAVGDGGSENGSVLQYGEGGGPVLRLAGPSRATLRDFMVSATGANGADALVVEDADQDQGRIYTEQLNTSGSGDQLVRHAVNVDGSQATVAIMGSSFVKGGDGWSFGDAWSDQTNPDAQVAVFGCNGTIQANKQANVLPDAALLRTSLEQIRCVHIAPPGEQPADATDLKIFRVGVGGGAGKDAVRFQARRPATGSGVHTKSEAEGQPRSHGIRRPGGCDEEHDHHAASHHGSDLPGHNVRGRRGGAEHDCPRHHRPRLGGRAHHLVRGVQARRMAREVRRRG